MATQVRAVQIVPMAHTIMEAAVQIVLTVLLTMAQAVVQVVQADAPTRVEVDVLAHVDLAVRMDVQLLALADVLAHQKVTFVMAVKAIVTALAGQHVPNIVPMIVLVIAMLNVLEIAHNSVKEVVMALVRECAILGAPAAVKVYANIHVKAVYTIKR